MEKFKRKSVACIIFITFISSVYGHSLTGLSYKIDTVMENSCHKNEFSGAVLVAIDNQIIFEKACGLASRGFNVPNNMDTKFNLGSVGKLFTSVAIAQLIQKKQLSLSTLVSEVIPTWLPKDEKSKIITVGQLLIHASGLGTFMDDKRWKLGSDSGLYIVTKDYQPLIEEDHFLYKPGSSQSYSNNGYLLLGAIVEAVTKTTYSDYIQKNIFNPADMKNTGLWALDEIIPNRAEGYFKVCNQKRCYWKNNNFEAPFIGSSAGGAYSTIKDLFKFSKSLHKFNLASPTFSYQLLSSHIVKVSDDIKIKPYKIDDIEIPENFSPFGFAGDWNKYGFAVWKDPLLVGHTGGTEGASAFFATSPNGKYTIIMLSNMSGSGIIKLYKNIRKILGFSAEITNY